MQVRVPHRRAHALWACLCALPVLVLAGSGRAADLSGRGFYVFGDSAVEQGNLYTLPGRTPPGPPYYTSGGFTRDSNGPMWVERMAPGLTPLLGAASGDRRVNFGFSGATSGTDNIADPDPTGVLAQVSLLEQRIASGDLTVGPEDIFLVSAGPNDVIGALIAGGDAVAAAGAVAGNFRQAAVRMIAQGARTVLVDDIPDFAESPMFRLITAGNPALHDAFNALSASMRADLRAALASLRASAPAGTQVAVIPSNDLFRHILANPSAYGFGNVTDACYDQTSGALCAPDRTGQNAYLFLDDLHLTERGQSWQAAFADLYLDQLSGSVNRLVSVRSDEQVRALASDAALGRRGILALRPTSEAPGIFATGDLSALASGDDGAADRIAGRVAAGVRGKLSSGVLYGLDATWTEGRTDANGAYAWDAHRLALNGSALVPLAEFYALASLGLAHTSYSDISRRTGLPGYAPRASQSGWSGIAGLEIGREFDVSGWALRPNAGLSVTYATLDAFQERDAGALAMGFSRGSRTVVTGRLGFDIESPAYQLGDGALRVTLSTAYLHDLHDDGSVTGRMLDAIAGPVETRLGTARRDRFEVSPAVQFTRGDWSLTATYGVSLDKDEAMQTLSVGARVKF